MDRYQHEVMLFVKSEMSKVITRQRADGEAEALLKLRQESEERLVSLAMAYASDWPYMSLIQWICTQKIEMLSKATTKKEVSSILKPSKPHLVGNRYNSTNPYHVDEEELLLWLIAGLCGPLGQYEFNRFWELFERAYPEEAKRIEGTNC